MNTRQIVPAIGLLLLCAPSWAQTNGQNSGTFGSPDIYNTGKTGSKTLPPEDSKNTTGGTAGTAENPLKKTLQDVYNRCVAATKKRDESVMNALRTSDFTYRDAKGKSYARGDVEANERQTLTSAVSIDQASSQVQSVQENGGTVTAKLRHYFAETTKDPQNNPHKITLNTTSEEVWTRSANAWKVQSVKVISQSETMDGKPYDPSKANAKNNQNKNNQNNGQQARANSGYPSYRAPRIRMPRIRTFGGAYIP